jgi:hypothetical protein
MRLGSIDCVLTHKTTDQWQPAPGRSIAPAEQAPAERASLHRRLRPSLPRAPETTTTSMENLAEGLSGVGGDGPVASFLAGMDGLDEPGWRRSGIPQVSSSSLSLCSDPPSRPASGFAPAGPCAEAP